MSEIKGAQGRHFLTEDRSCDRNQCLISGEQSVWQLHVFIHLSLWTMHLSCLETGSLKEQEIYIWRNRLTDHLTSSYDAH